MQVQQWAVVGAGAAGIASVGHLLDQGIDPQQIIWIDPSFSGGDIAQKWLEVPSNTKVGLFHQFFKHCQAFEIAQAPNFALFQMPVSDTCQLKMIIPPLKWVIKTLANKVQTIQTNCLAIDKTTSEWQLTLEKNTRIYAHKVILAIGAEPKQAIYAQPTTIKLTQALNPTLLAAQVTANDIIAVFGSSHSAILIIKNLVELGIKKIINFYRQPLRYAQYYPDGILYDNTGLKGIAATWAKQYIEEYPLENLQRVLSTKDTIQTLLPQADKAIYSIGFNRRSILLNQQVINAYDMKTGRIDQHLYGVGIAFPERIIDRTGNEEFNVGLWKFAQFLEKNISNWISE